MIWLKFDQNIKEYSHKNKQINRLGSIDTVKEKEKKKSVIKILKPKVCYLRDGKLGRWGSFANICCTESNIRRRPVQVSGRWRWRKTCVQPIRWWTNEPSLLWSIMLMVLPTYGLAITTNTGSGINVSLLLLKTS